MKRKFIKRYAVIGADSAVGKAIVQILAEKKMLVRAIARQPPEATEFIEPFVADVTNLPEIGKALNEEFIAVFFTEDLYGFFNSRMQIRDVMYHGCLNAMYASAIKSKPKFILLSIIGAERVSLAWQLYDAFNPGMKQSILDRERELKESGLPYVICRAPALRNGNRVSLAIAATPPEHKLTMTMGISRIDLAHAMIGAARHAPLWTTWDIFSNPAGPVPSWLETYLLSTRNGIEISL